VARRPESSGTGVMAGIDETSRDTFDMNEEEQEIVSGYHKE
jgi:NADH:ubiquinone oxidoreductase subunit H